MSIQVACLLPCNYKPIRHGRGIEVKTFSLDAKVHATELLVHETVLCQTDLQRPVFSVIILVKMRFVLIVKLRKATCIPVPLFDLEFDLYRLFSAQSVRRVSSHQLKRKDARCDTHKISL